MGGRGACGGDAAHRDRIYGERLLYALSLVLARLHLALEVFVDIAFLIFIAVAAAAAGIPTAITLWGGRDRRRRAESMERQCTAETLGTVTRVDAPAHGDPATRVHVAYEVDGARYEMVVVLKLKARDVGAGSYLFNIQKVYAVDGFTGTGDELRVRYAPGNPALAYLPDNDGMMDR